jgi:cytochrome b subunit of formate dehydrogenase
MFQTVSIFLFLATFIGIAVHWIAFPTNPECRGGCVVRGAIHVFSLLLIEQRLSLLGVLKKLCYLLAAVCFVMLGFTGFYPLLVQGKHISGYLMMIHATFAPIFAICLAILGLTWASRFRFEQRDCPRMQRLLRRVTRLRIAAPEGPYKCSRTAQKVAFWAVVALSLPLILSILLSMFPLVGTHWQEILLATHRWTAVFLAVGVIILTYLTIRIRMAE